MTPTRAAPSRNSSSSSSVVRPRRYFALWAITTTSASRAPDLPQAVDDLVLPVADRAETEQQPGTGPPYAVHDLQQRLETGLVVRQVDDDADAGPRVKKFIRPGLCSMSGRNDLSPSTTAARGRPTAERGRGGSQRVLDVEPGQPRQRHRDVDDLDQRVGVAVGGEHREPAVDHGGGPAARGQGLPDRRGVRVAGEHPRPGLDRAPAREDARVVAVEHRPTVRPGDPGDDALDLGELVDGVDALLAQMVRGDVGEHRDVVVGDPDALEQDAAAGRLGDRELDLRVGQHPAGPGRPGVVTGLDQLARRRRSRRCWTSRRAARATRAMWAIIREVVVLPLVPVTATTGTRGRNVVGAGPGSASRTAAAAWLTRSSRSGLGSASSTSATAWPSASARCRARHG